MPENAEAGRKGGGIAKRARLELEQKTGRSVVTGENFLPPAETRKRLGSAVGGALTAGAVFPGGGDALAVFRSTLAASICGIGRKKA